MSKLNWEKANGKEHSTLLDFKVKKQYIKRPRKSSSICIMRGCKDKKHKTASGIKQNYCLSHCMTNGKKI